jgi:hypothetical protein
MWKKTDEKLASLLHCLVTLWKLFSYDAAVCARRGDYTKSEQRLFQVHKTTTMRRGDQVRRYLKSFSRFSSSSSSLRPLFFPSLAEVKDETFNNIV